MFLEGIKKAHISKAIFTLLCVAGSSGAFAQSDSIAFQQSPVGPEKLHVLSYKHISYAVVAGSISYGLLAQEYKPLQRLDLNVRADLMEDYPGFSSHLDDELQYMPAASVYAMGFVGIKGKNNFFDKTALFFLSNTIMSMSVDFIKTQAHKLRPDGSDYRAFPSGHTATAFAAAEFMAQEYKDISPWYSVAGYAMASATGSLRMLNNKHWLSDVVAGAGVGILSTKLAYFVYPMAKKLVFKKKASGLTVLPAYQSNYLMCYASINLSKR